MNKTIPRAIKELSCTIISVCKSFGQSRDSYYKQKKRQVKQEVLNREVLSLIKEERLSQPRVGTLKLYRSLKPLLIDKSHKIGRDKFFSILRSENLLVKRKKSFCKTTDSNHPFYKYSNIVKGIGVTDINQVWVSDITYIRLVKGHCYLSIITDAYSRKIVGFDISDSLELSGCLRSLEMALKSLPKGHSLIHHSDRGSQYCSYAYTDLLKKHNIRISMTEENHCYENALAERVNGILKDEYYLDLCFNDLSLASKASINAICIYNSKRTHMSLDYLTPNQVYHSKGEDKNKIQKQIKNYYFYPVKQNANEPCWRATRQG